MSYLNEVAKIGIFQLFCILLWVLADSISDYVRWNYHKYFMIIGIVKMLMMLAFLILCIINSITLLRNYAAGTSTRYWLLIAINLLPLCYVFLSVLYIFISI